MDIYMYMQYEKSDLNNSKWGTIIRNDISTM